MRKCFLAAAALALLFAGTSGSARTSEGVLDGVVINAKGTPVAFAQVFWQTADGKEPHAVRANGKGYFRVAGIRQGLYEVRAQALGMTSEWEHNVWVPAGRVSSITLHLTHPTVKSTPAALH